MNYANIKYNDIADGVGVRTALFVSGCTHHCEDCFNQIAWDFNYGKPFTDRVIDEIIERSKPYYISGLTLLGGEPMEPENQRGLLPLAEKFKKNYPDKTIWCYSGYTYEQLTGFEDSRCRCEVTDRLLGYIDVLVDGKFIKEQHSITLKFRGSSNQRLIDLNRTRENNKIILWQDDPVFEKKSLY